MANIDISGREGEGLEKVGLETRQQSLMQMSTMRHYQLSNPDTGSG